MKKLTFLVGILFSIQASSAVLFEDDFESGLVAWTGKGGGAHNGTVTADTLDPLNKVLSFSATTLGGDIFTTAGFQSGPGDYVLSYDYLGTCSNNDCGGYIGYSFGLPGNHAWLGGTGTVSGAMDLNKDTGEWIHVEIPFTSTQALPIHVMVEDYSGAGNGRPSDAYFDNIRLESVGVPEPTSLALLGLGLAVVGVGARRKRR